MYLPPSDWKYVEERAASFVGREWVFAQVRSFLCGPPGTFLLRGDPGTGKTAVAAWLALAASGRVTDGSHGPAVAEGTISAAVFCRAGKTTVAELIQRLSGQLARSVAGFSDSLESALAPEIRIGDVRVEARDVQGDVTGVRILLDDPTDERAFHAGLSIPLRNLREHGSNQRIVLLVDAIDEAVTGGQTNTLSRLLSGLDGIHLIVTCRPSQSVLSDFRNAKQKVDLVANMPSGEHDVRDYVGNRLAGNGREAAIDVLADRIAAEADGNFLYAFYVTEALLETGSLASTDEKAARDLLLPTGGLAGVYEDFIDRQIAGNETRWTEALRPVLAPLCVALGDGFSTVQLAAIACRLAGRNVSPAHASDVTRAAGQFLEGPHPNGPFRVYHQSFARFLTDPGQNPNWPIDPAETSDAVWRALRDAVPEDQSGTKDWQAADPYTTKYLALHAATAGRLDDLLTDPGFLVAADPSALLSVLDSANGDQARRVAWFYRLAAGGLRTGDAAERAAHLQLAAGKASDWEMASAFGKAAASWHWSTNVATWRPPGVYTTLGNTRPVRCSAITVTEQAEVLMVTGGLDDTVRLWRLGADELAPVGDPQPGHGGFLGITSAAVGQLHGQTVAVTSGHGGAIALWRLGTDGLAPVGDPQPNRSLVMTVAVGMMDGQTVAVTGGLNDAVRLWRLDADGLAPIGDPQPGQGGVFGVKAVAVGELHGRAVAVTGGGNGTLVLWRLGQEGLAPIGEPESAGSVGNVAVAVGELNGQTVAVTGGLSGMVALWRLSENGLALIGEPQRGAFGVNTIALGELHGQTVVVTGGLSGTVALWQPSEDGLAPIGSPQRGPGGPGGVVAVAAGPLPGNNAVVTSGSDGTVALWRPRADGLTPNAYAQPTFGEVPIHSVAIGEVRGWGVAVTGWSKGVVTPLWLEDGSPIGHWQRHSGGHVTGVSVGKLWGRSLAVTVASNGTAALWWLDSNGLSPVRKPRRAHPAGHVAVAVGELHGRAVAVTGGTDGKVALWRLGKKGLAPIGEPHPAHGNGNMTVAVGELNGEVVAVTSGRGGTVALWQLTERGLAPIGDPQRCVDGLQASELTVGTFGGQCMAVAGGFHGTLTLWRLSETGLTSIGSPQSAHGGTRVHAAAVGELHGQTMLATGGDDGTVMLWRPRPNGLESLPTVQIPLGSPVLSITIYPPATMLVWCTDGVLWAGIAPPSGQGSAG